MDNIKQNATTAQIKKAAYEIVAAEFNLLKTDIKISLISREMRLQRLSTNFKNETLDEIKYRLNHLIGFEDHSDSMTDYFHYTSELDNCRRVCCYDSDGYGEIFTAYKADILAYISAKCPEFAQNDKNYTNLCVKFNEIGHNIHTQSDIKNIGAFFYGYNVENFSINYNIKDNLLYIRETEAKQNKDLAILENPNIENPNICNNHICNNHIC